MRVVIQRVSRAVVRVNGRAISKIERGIVVLVGFSRKDGETELEWIAHKLASLRIFDDIYGKLNLSVKEIDGSALVVSQFTLYADVRKGRRPAFVNAAEPERAEELYDHFCDLLRNEGVIVESGKFGAKMDVELVNDGPVTIILER